MSQPRVTGPTVPGAATVDQPWAGVPAGCNSCEKHFQRKVRAKEISFVLSALRASWVCQHWLWLSVCGDRQVDVRLVLP